MNTVTGEIFFFSLYLNGRDMALTQLRVQGTGIILLVICCWVYALIKQTQG
jgi:hypothetical protein